MIAPIKPEDVQNAVNAAIPDYVIESFNIMIERNFSNGRSRFKLDDAIHLILAHPEASEVGLTSNMLFKNHWLNVESIYREAGWGVYFDQPGYNENYPANFEFKVLKK